MKLNLYDQFYYSYYKNLGRLGNYDLGFKATMLLSAVLGLNVITGLFYFELVGDWLTKYWVVAISSLALFFNYFYFVFDRRYLKIEKELTNWSLANKLIGPTFTIISILTFFAVVSK